MVVPQSGLLIYGCKKMQDCEELALLHLFVKNYSVMISVLLSLLCPTGAGEGGGGGEKLKKKN